MQFLGLISVGVTIPKHIVQIEKAEPQDREAFVEPRGHGTVSHGTCHGFENPQG